MPLDMVIDIGIIVLVFVSIALCVVLIVVLAKLAPPLLRSSRHLEKISGDVAAVSENVANDVATTTHNAAMASESAVATLGHLEKISGDAAAVSEEVTSDIATTARNASTASQNAVEASRNMVDASKDAVRAAMALAAIANMDIRGILTQVVAGNVKNAKDLAQLVVRHLPEGLSRVGSILGRNRG